ncbi:MAG TPA: orotate phosphoribosyltransferase [Candidatus Xenobia bacterium]|nr:orotate phosphoribosyltransferase [Candidatus Xenobia bacterium]
MAPSDVQQMLEDTGAIRRGHFRLSSGLHSPLYVQCMMVLQYPALAARLADEAARQAASLEAQTVAAPALGGITWGYELARVLNARAIFVERNADGRFALRRFGLMPGERVLVAEDVLTTGGSTRETMEVIRAAGGEVVGVAAIVDRSQGKVDFGVPLRALLTLSIETYAADECPLCRAGQPVEKPGSKPG